MAAPAKYNPKKVILIWNKIRLGGFVLDSFILAKPDEARAKKTIGLDGKATVTLNPNLGGSVEFTLQQRATANDILSALVPSANSNSLPAGELLLEDLNATTVLHAEIAWLTSFPEVGFGSDAGDRKWMLDCEELDFLVGGNIL